ncbi:MAG: nucleotide exchange factor GrpE, partial [Firmicutes bacterium]|nr:nucleotide exchange factor GrpE [Bacillota bacterium]
MSEEKTIPIEDMEETMTPEENPAEEQDMAEQTEGPAETEVPEGTVKEEAPQDDAEKRYQELNTRYMRLAADFQNQKKRYEKEKADIYMYAGEDIIKKILDV